MQADIENLMARLLTDRALRERFRDDPAAVANEAGLSAPETEAMCRISVQDLFTAARTYEHKRSMKRRRSLKHRMLDWWRAKRASR
jgi:anti-sigma-K factor RskA